MSGFEGNDSIVRTVGQDKEFRALFGARLKELRKKREWSQKELATKLETSVPQLNKYESGASMPTPEKLVHVAEIFETTVDFLLTGDRADAKPLHNLRLVDRLRAIESFKKDEQEALITMIDALIVKHRVEGVLEPVERKKRAANDRR